MADQVSNDKSLVGYKRPPERTRFQPGVSGNPAGRPKRRPTLQSVLAAELAAPANDFDRAVTKLHALARTLVGAAIAGDTRALTLLLGVLSRFEESEEPEEGPLTSEDREILEAYVGAEAENEKPCTNAEIDIARQSPTATDQFQQTKAE